MKIIKKQESIYISKPEGTNVSYYLRDEYEFHYNEQIPGSSQKWHHHEKVLEIVFIIEGELTLKWRENNETKEQIVLPGDLIEIGNSIHTFVNHTDKIAKFVVVKQILSGENKKEALKNDKILDE